MALLMLGDYAAKPKNAVRLTLPCRPVIRRLLRSAPAQLIALEVLTIVGGVLILAEIWYFWR